MKPQAPRSRSGPQRPARSLARRPCAGSGPLSPASSALDDRLLLSNLPNPLPVTRDEMDLVRSYFADLITAALKDSP